MLERIYGKVGISVNIREEVVAFMFDTSTCMLWRNTPMDQAEELKELIREIVDHFFEPNISDFFPLIAPLDLQGKQRKMRMISHRFDEFFDLSINEKAKQGDDAKDFLGILKLGEDKQQTPFIMDNIKGVIATQVRTGDGGVAAKSRDVDKSSERAGGSSRKGATSRGVSPCQTALPSGSHQGSPAHAPSATFPELTKQGRWVRYTCRHKSRDQCLGHP